MPRIYVDTIKEVANLETKIQEMCAALCAGKEMLNWPKVPSVDTLIKKTREPLTEDQIIKLIERLPEDDKHPYRREATEQLTFIIGAIPKSSMSTLAGPVRVNPSDLEVFAFEGLYRIVDDPLYVIRLMSRGALLQSQGDLCRKMFPSISTFIDQSIQDAIENEKAKNKDYQVPYLADSGIRDWRKIPIMIAPYQQMYFKDNQKRKGAAPPGPSQAQFSPESKSSLSAAQSALYRQIGK